MVSSGGATQADELRMLRARAYGPQADIHDDAAALERLRELEERAFPAAEPDAEEAETPEPETPEPGAPESDGAELASVERASGWHRFVPTTRRGWVAVAAVCAAVAVVVTAAVTTAVVRTVQADPRTIATLPVDPTNDLADAFGGFSTSTQPSVAHTDFYGLTPIVIPGWGETPGRCLVLTPTAGLDAAANGWSSVGGMNCEAGSFSSSVQFIVSADYGIPAEFRDRFPDRTALRFVLEGSSVVVMDGTPE
ncbi:hypothetical protein DEU34_1945 [Microbacterium sp. AG1240]|uniref:hypothetical protein n=1 Tax=Microbacterium sp. AG1240 TaxID=2183992 RepID=UPI000EAE7076|nr:hypothetical protein [Microbacterium sp. AG1240]RKT33354.1 hypothetical protein DEU34_1945 [Microbacterium sp. AG1240]